MPAPDNSVWQAAALPVSGGKVCLVTSSSGRRWVLPKGVVETGWTPAECAVQEAWEEAGVVGDLDPDPVGTYVFEKSGRTHHVTVYRLRVSDILDHWPECELRRRAWLSPAEALWRIDVPALQDVMRSTFDPADVPRERIAR